MHHGSDIVARAANVGQTAVIARSVAELTDANDVIVLGGDLGAGKTAFTKALGEALGVTDPITSPTFTLAQRYESGRLVLHHLDVYRLEQLDETLDLALPELCESGGVVVIEWGDTILPALPREYLMIRFEFGDLDDERTLCLSSNGARWHSRFDRLRESLPTQIVL